MHLEPGIDWLLRYATDAMIIVDQNGIIVLSNPPAERMFGFLSGELTGHTVEELIPDRLRGPHAGLRKQYSQHPRARGMGEGRELYGRRCDGDEFPVEVSLSPLHTKAGAPHVMAVIHDITLRVRAEQALLRSQSELRQLSAHQDQLKEQERKRIAQEIHDELGALLTGIKAHISVSMERQAKAGGQPDPLLAEAMSLSDAAIQTVRKVITDLRPSVLDQLGIWAALEWYVGQIQERSGLVCACTIAPQLQDVVLDPQRSTMVFRVVQEALTNVVRHAQAAHIDVSAQRLGEALQVCVKDDGKGIDTERLLNRDSWGLLGMYERSRYFGGDLRITGTQGNGTMVTLLLPLESGHDQ